jgi:hypothetical protein
MTVYRWENRDGDGPFKSGQFRNARKARKARALIDKLTEKKDAKEAH